MLRNISHLLLCGLKCPLPCPVLRFGTLSNSSRSYLYIRPGHIARILSQTEFLIEWMLSLILGPRGLRATLSVAMNSSLAFFFPGFIPSAPLHLEPVS